MAKCIVEHKILKQLDIFSCNYVCVCMFDEIVYSHQGSQLVVNYLFADTRISDNEMYSLVLPKHGESSLRICSQNRSIQRNESANCS